MKELAKHPDFKEIETKWQKYWKDKKLYKFNPKTKKKIYSIDVPPRYVSGPLHIGHATSYTHLDISARYRRLAGYEVFDPLCFDVNGLPIEVNVEKLGIHPEEVGRKKFIEECSKFGKKNIDTMTSQFEKLGHCFDDSIYYQTNAPYFRRVTQLTFIDFYNKGLIYKDEAPVNWCTRCKTALANAEAEKEDRKTKLNYVKFYFNEKIKKTCEWIDEDEKGSYVQIATTRPEFLPACVGIFVHPDDARYKSLVGKEAKVPLFNFKVKIRADELVAQDFGSGIVMVCTFGDTTDVEWWRKHKLELKNLVTSDGKLSEIAEKYAGLTLKEGRDAVMEDLEGQGMLLSQSDLDQSVSTCWRCHTPIEYVVTKQWFLKVLPFKKDILRIAKKVNWFPKYMFKRFEEWTRDLTWDWCISRQRYFATPIPVWTCEKCGEVVLAKLASTFKIRGPPKSESALNDKSLYVDPVYDTPPIEKCTCGGKLIGETDVFDTWIDSSLTAIYNCYYGRDSKMFKKMYPMSLRPQAHDIIRTWAFYTIVRAFHLFNKEPWKDIAISGFIMGPDGTPMHTSKGNVVNPTEVVDKYGADAFRYFASKTDLGVDAPFKYLEVEHATKLSIKIWNISKFIASNLAKPKKAKLNIEDKWILSRLSQVIKFYKEHMDVYEFTPAVKEVEGFIWHEFADFYLEMIKNRLYNNVNANAAKYTLYTTWLACIKMLAPIMPHITEELYGVLFAKFEKENSIHISTLPKEGKVDKKALELGELAVQAISEIRKYKQQKNLSLGAELETLELTCPKKEIKELVSKTMRVKNLKIKEGKTISVKE